jgi:glyoxylase-like metal-dependent hydrolase (beta-lactamase superfamily II)
MPVPIQKRPRAFGTAEGARIFQLPLEAFPGFWVNAYLVIVGEYRVLIDTGSGLGKSNDDLEAGLEEVGASLDRPIGFADLTHILVTHGHIDHYGGLAYLQAKTSAQVGIHELDRRALTNHAERYRLNSSRLEPFLAEAGVNPSERLRLLEMYNLPSTLYPDTRVDFTFGEIGNQLGPFVILHVPGHSPGQVVIRLHDALFSGDHVLAGISPHQAPERVNLNAGLGHYIPSLDAVSAWAGDVRVTLGGHNEPILDLRARVLEIRREHEARFRWVLDYLATPHTIAEVSQDLFGAVSGYNELLALEEAGAHVEYLYERGALKIANLDEMQPEPHPGPIYYIRQDL